MKKSLIALTLAALPVAAMADVTLYGQIKAGVDISKVKTGDKVVAKKQVGKKTATEIADYGSRIGFKGHEHLGSNLNAIWQVEQKTSIAGGDSGFANRESFLGLEGGFGKVRAGNLNTALNDSSDSFDPWESGADNENALQLGKIKRVDDRKVSVRYDTPVLGGFSASVQYQPRDNANHDDRYTHKEKSRDSYDLGLNYENSGFFGRYAGSYAKRKVLNDAHLDAFNHNTTLGAGTYKDHQAHRLTAGYDANNLMVAVVGQYEGFKADVAGAKKNERTEVGATAAYRFGNVTPRVSYAHGFKAKEEGVKRENSAYNQVIVGADYDFSKRTSALLSAGWLKEGKGDTKYEKTAGTVGLRHKF
ncbi:trimeric porin PorB [uncultured Neisseria sp.]|uniref:trimeric porin PorB n=1 Tax=uncultured Neisseria sp. TaxID=237778 RepID=UPI0025CCAC97|nr:trimeric porin PorB [uncultured Neisseria sp.]